MKKKNILYIVLFSIFSYSAYAQPMAENRNECLKSYSTYRNFIKINLYEFALQPWKETFDNCPDFSKNIYIDGVKIYKNILENTKDINKRNAYVDTICFILDKRVEYFGQKKQISARKASFILKYKQSDSSGLQAYKLFDYYLTDKKNIKPWALMYFFKSSTQVFIKQQINSQQYTKDFFRVHEICATHNDKSFAKVEASALVQYASNINCNIIDTDLYEIFLKNKNDTSIIKLLNKIILTNGCIKSELYAIATERLYEISPDSMAALSLARMFFRRNNYHKAEKYYIEAANKFENDRKKARIYYEYAINLSRQNKFEQAKKLALKAYSYDKTFGRPFILIATMYARSYETIEGNEFQKSAVFWVAVDMLEKAKKIDPKLTNEVNSLIENYKKHFPNREDAFMNGIAAGDEYTVGGWINQKTKARFIKI